MTVPTILNVLLSKGQGRARIVTDRRIRYEFPRDTQFHQAIGSARSTVRLLQADRPEPVEVEPP